MQKLSVFVLVLALGVLGLGAGSAHAQVVIQGQVTVGQDPYVQQGGGNYVQQGGGNYVQQGGGNYVQQTDPNAGYATSAYVAQPTGQPQPVRYIHRSAIMPAIIIPGIVLLAGGYLSQVIGMQTIDYDTLTSDQRAFGYIPLVGPWLQLANYDDSESPAVHFSWITGVAQAVGLVLMVVGLTVHEEWDEPVYALTDDPMGPTLAFDGSRATLAF